MYGLNRIFLFLLLMAPLVLSSQSDSIQLAEPDSLLQEPVLLEQDTSIVLDSDTTSLDFEDSLKLNPNKSLMWSAFIPGGGQVYNKQYWKAPIFPALVATGIYLTIDNNKNYRAYNEELILRQSTPSDSVNFLDLTTPHILHRKLKFKRRRSLSLALTMTSYSFNLMDAFASTNLINSKLDHSPARAAYLSAVLPGLGQVYNKKWWKVPVIYAGFAVGGGAIGFNFIEMRDYTNGIIFFGEDYYIGPPKVAGLSLSNLQRNRERSLKRLELSIILTSLWYVVNILDATVDGHLHDFDKEMEGFAHFSISPKMTALQDGNVAWGYGLTWRF